jgi:TonB family protein
MRLAAVLSVGLSAVAQEPDRPAGPARIAGGVMAGHILNRVNPVYPPVARAAGVTGAVVLHAIIGKNGTIENLAVISGPEMLRGSALDAVSQWQYQPYLLNGEPTEVDTTITVNYQIESAPPPAETTVRGMVGSGPPPPAVSVRPNGEAGPFRVSGGVMAGMILTKVAPVYPADANVYGAVVLHAMIGKDGKVNSLQVISGPVMLRTAAIDAARQWTYKPYLVNGQPVEVDTVVTVNFNADPPPEQDEATAPVRVSGGVMAGAILTKSQPVYPADAACQHVAGAIVLHAIVGTDGRVKSLEPISGPLVLRQPAMDAVKQWTYKPYLVNGEPVEVDTTITMNVQFGAPAPGSCPRLG